MAKTRARRDEPPPDPDRLVLRGILGNTGLDPADLRQAAVINQELYGFYGVSVWVTSAAYPRELLESTKLIKFQRYAEFTVADLTGRGLALWARPAPALRCGLRKETTWNLWSRGWLARRTGSGTTRTSTGRSTEMIYIDLPADLNLEDDHGRNIARLSDAVTPEAVTPGAVLVAGTSRAWSWAVVDAVDTGFVHFRQVSAQEAARRASLVAPLPRSA